MQDACRSWRNIISIDQWLSPLASLRQCGRTLDSSTFILLLLISSVVIELPVQVSACVETKARAFFYITLWSVCVVWGFVESLPEQNQDVVFCFIHCSKIWRLKLALEVKGKR